MEKGRRSDYEYLNKSFKQLQKMKEKEEKWNEIIMEKDENIDIKVPGERGLCCVIISFLFCWLQLLLYVGLFFGRFVFVNGLMDG